MRTTPGGTRTFSMNDLCLWSGATPPQVEYWVRQEIIVPAKDSDGRGSPREFSLANVIQAALARQLSAETLAASAMSVKQLRLIFSQLRDQVEKVRPELRASATFVVYVKMIKALVAIIGEGPNYATWLEGVTAILRSWEKKPTQLDDRILQILAGARAAERDAAHKSDARH